MYRIVTINGEKITSRAIQRGFVSVPSLLSVVREQALLMVWSTIVVIGDGRRLPLYHCLLV